MIVRRFARRHPRLAVVHGSALAGAAVGGVLVQQRRVLAYLVVVLLCTVVVAALDRLRSLRTVSATLMCVLAVLHLVGGLGPGPASAPFYETWLVPGGLKYDQAVHLFGTAAVTAVAWDVVAVTAVARASVAVRALAAASVALVVGVVNELLEALAAETLPATAVGGLTNTAWDLVFNTVGVVVALALLLGWEAGRAVNRRGTPAAVGAPRPSPTR